MECAYVIVEGGGEVVVGVLDLLTHRDELLVVANGEEAVVAHQDRQLHHRHRRETVRRREDPNI